MRDRSPLPPAPYPSLQFHFSVQGITGGATAIVDTRFDGHLAVPSELVAALPKWTELVYARTESGSDVLVPIYEGVVELIDQPGYIAASIIAFGDRFLLGLAMLNHFRVTFDHGQRVIVER